GEQVLGPIDNAQVLRAAALDCGLEQPFSPMSEKLERLNDHTFPTSIGKRLPPVDGFPLTRDITQRHGPKRCGDYKPWYGFDKLRQRPHVPHVVLVRVYVSLARQEMEGCKAYVAQVAHIPAIATITFAVRLDSGIPFSRLVEQSSDVTPFVCRLTKRRHR